MSAATTEPSEQAIESAVRALGAGELIVFPTETIYGIGCDASSPRALERLCAAKQRPEEKGFAVIVADTAMASALSSDVSPAARRLMDRFWPGPLTILLPARADLPATIVRDGLIGVRVSGHPLARRLARELGRPIAAPSANPADVEPAHDIAAARAMFGDLVAVYLDGGVLGGLPSTLVVPGESPRILREGAIVTVEIQRVARGG